MKYARIETGTVRETIDFDPTGRFHPSLVFVPCPDNCERGWTYDGSTFAPYIPPPPTAEELAKIARRQALADETAAAKADATVQYLHDHTVAEVDAYIQAQVTDLASVKVMLRKFGAILCVLAKKNL